MLRRGERKILGGAEACGRPIARVLLTHAHMDHIGSLDALHASVPDAEVIISARDARLMAKDMSLDPGEPVDKLRGGYPGAETKPDRTIAAGDRVGSLEAIAAPGHTPGQLAFLDAVTAPCSAPTPTRPSPGWPPRPRSTRCSRSSTGRPGTGRPRSRPRARCGRSTRKRLAPGHGKVVEEPGAVMDAAIAKAS